MVSMPAYKLSSDSMCGQQADTTTFPNGSTPSVPRASQYYRRIPKSNLDSFLRAASFVYAAISRRAASTFAGNLLVRVRSDLVHPGHSRRGPCFGPGAPPPQCLRRLPSLLGGLPWPSPLLPVPTPPTLKVTLPLKLENSYSTRAPTSFWI